MRRRNQPGDEHGAEFRPRQAADQALNAEPMEPVLLALAGDVDPPPATGYLGCEALGYGRL